MSRIDVLMLALEMMLELLVMLSLMAVSSQSKKDIQRTKPLCDSGKDCLNPLDADC